VVVVVVVVVALVAFKLLMEGWSARKDLSAVKGRKPHDELTPFTACLPAKEGPPHALQEPRYASANARKT
jgi:hypothetical protein